MVNISLSRCGCSFTIIQTTHTQSVNASNEHDRNDRADKRTRRTDWINAPHTCWGQGIHTYLLALGPADGGGETERGMCHVQRLQYKMKLDKL